MTGPFDHLLDQLGDEGDDKRPGQIPLDIADLPPAQRQVMFYFLRDAKETADTLTLDALREQFADLDNLPEILAELTQQNWLIRLGEPPNVRYKINFRRRRASGLADDMWASLTDRLAEDDSSDSNPTDDDPHDKPAFPSLSDW
jgi:hypothetical protein